MILRPLKLGRIRATMVSEVNEIAGANAGKERPRGVVPGVGLRLPLELNLKWI